MARLDLFHGLKPGLGRGTPLRAYHRAEGALQGVHTVRGGFTLLEVLVALALGALVVLLAHRVFTGVMDGARRVAEARAALDRWANARRLLTEIARSIDVGSHSDGFDGRPDRAAFSTWTRVPQGWLERRRVQVGGERGALILTGSGPEPLVLADSVAQLDLDYLLDAGADAAWVRTWQSPVSAPLAIRMRVWYRGRGNGEGGSVDTLVLVVGPRG